MTIFLRRVSTTQYACVHGELELKAALANSGRAQALDVLSGESLEAYLSDGEIRVRSSENVFGMAQRARMICAAALAKAKASARAAA